jgi:hypothetical protein
MRITPNTKEKYPLVMWESNDRTPNAMCSTCGWIYVARDWRDLAVTAIRHKTDHARGEY